MAIKVLSNPSDVASMVQSYLDKDQPNTYRLSVVADGLRQDGDWWYVVVVPDRNGVRAHDYSEKLTTIEDRIREKEQMNLLLVPALVDD